MTDTNPRVPRYLANRNEWTVEDHVRHQRDGSLPLPGGDGSLLMALGRISPHAAVSEPRPRCPHTREGPGRRRPNHARPSASEHYGLNVGIADGLRGFRSLPGFQRYARGLRGPEGRS